MNFRGGGATCKTAPASNLGDKVKRKGFTLSEVLITMGIIGIVAAMTLPSLINRAQEKELEARFRKAYNIMNVATQKTVADLGFDPQCYIWETKPYGPLTCTKDDRGECTYTYNGGAIPDDYYGEDGDCNEFYAAFEKNLNIIQKCTHMEEEGCTVHYKGSDTVMKENDDSLSDNDIIAATTANKTQREEIFNTLSAIVLMDGMTIIDYNTLWPYIDINGKKGPNKWGYDLFRFKRVGGRKRGIYYAPHTAHPVEKGGRTCVQMFETLFER